MLKALYFTCSGKQCESWIGIETHEHIDNVLDFAPMSAEWAVSVGEGEAVVYRLPPVYRDPLKPRNVTSLHPEVKIILPTEDAARAYIALNT